MPRRAVRREIEPLRDRVRPPRNEQAKGSSRRLPCLSGDRRQGSGGTTHDLDALADDLGAAAAGHGALQTVARSRPEDGSVTHHLKPACHPSIGVGQRDLVSHVRTLCTSSSRADTARTRRRYIRPALAAASLRERAGRLARDTELWLCCDGVREREARIVRSRPPRVKPAARPDPSGPSAHRSLSSGRHHGMQARPEGPDGSGVNGLTLGPLRLLGRLSPAGQGPAVSDTRLPLPQFGKQVKFGKQS
jgi:hypothetical protein